ncbi:MAG: hypothetical protein AAFO69_11035 [Bacteroidota bacterium]
MKYLSMLILTLSMCGHLAYSQKYVDSNNPDEVKSLLSKNNDVTGFGGLDIKVGDFNEERALFTGAYGGVIINRHYFLGVAGYGLVTENRFIGDVPGFDDPRELNLYGGYGGLMIGGIIAPKQIVHLTVPVILGAGTLYVSDEDFFNQDDFVINTFDADLTIDQTTFFVIEPGLNIEANITRSFRISLGVTYRLVRGINLDQQLDDDDFSQISGLLCLRFGRF